MGGINESIKNLINVSSDQKIVDNYAKEVYNTKFNGEQEVWYEGFSVIDEGNLEIKYGYGDMSNSFKHKIKK